MIISSSDTHIELTAEIIAAYVSHNSVPSVELPDLMIRVHAAIEAMTTDSVMPSPEPERLIPAVSIKKSLTEDYLICLEDGQRFKSLKRHLMSTYGMTPEQYREKWALPATYPMVAPAYSKARSALAFSLGLGRKAVTPPAPVAEVTKPRRAPRKQQAA